MQDSLAAEIEGTMRRELSVEEETAFQDQRLMTCYFITITFQFLDSVHCILLTFDPCRLSQKRVFHTVRSVNESAARAASANPPIPGSGHSSLVMTSQPFHSTQEYVTKSVHFLSAL